MTQEQYTFQTEVTRLLDIVAKSLYTHQEIFLRELISNASDACDKRRHLALSQPDVLGDETLQLVISIDEKKRLLTLSDNGIGMDKEALVENLGTIAHSGTAKFMDHIATQGGNADTLIGQFGVGFYSIFMVSDWVEVRSLTVGSKQAHLWRSEGNGTFIVDTCDKKTVGTEITLHLKKEADEYLKPYRLEEIVRKYSDHIAFPIILKDDKEERQINRAQILWRQRKEDITPEQYKEFYRHTAHAFDEPFEIIHHRAEGVVEYAALLFLPTMRPFDLFNPERKHHVKLYVRRVFITDDMQEILPAYLRFLTGVVDVEDLPLNISRETLQFNPRITKIKNNLVKKVLDHLKTLMTKERARYGTFWNSFGIVLKEGLYEDQENRPALLDLCLFSDSQQDDKITLSDYVAKMLPTQKEIFVLTGENTETLRQSPQLEGFQARGIPVLLLTDAIDEYWLTSVGEYQGKTFRNITKGTIDLDALKERSKKDQTLNTEQSTTLVTFFKTCLVNDVEDVRASSRLDQSPVCLVASDNAMDPQMEMMLKQYQGTAPKTKRILEINPDHPLLIELAEKLEKKESEKSLEDIAFLLFEQANVLDGRTPSNTQRFAQSLDRMLKTKLETL